MDLTFKDYKVMIEAYLELTFRALIEEMSFPNSFSGSAMLDLAPPVVLDAV